MCKTKAKTDGSAFNGCCCNLNCGSFGIRKAGIRGQRSQVGGYTSAICEIGVIRGRSGDTSVQERRAGVRNAAGVDPVRLCSGQAGALTEILRRNRGDWLVAGPKCWPL
jgi:hypothetical protein